MGSLSRDDEARHERHHRPHHKHHDKGDIYPDPPNESTASNQGMIFRLGAGQSVTGQVNFAGHATGCAVLLINEDTGNTISWVKHDRAVSPENLIIQGANNNQVRDHAFSVSAWTFIGGPPLDPGAPHTPGYNLVAPIPGSGQTHATWRCYGSANGATDVSVDLTFS